MLLEGFEPNISVIKLQQTDVLENTAAGLAIFLLMIEIIT